MHIQPDKVAQPMREEERHHAIGYQFGGITAQNAQVDQTPRR